MERCKTCKFYKQDDSDCYGQCKSDKFIYGYFYPSKVRQEAEDILLYFDYEGYSASFEVGPMFGCVHHEESL